MVTCQSSELGWEVTVELPADFLSLGRGSVMPSYAKFMKNILSNKKNFGEYKTISLNEE